MKIPERTVALYTRLVETIPGVEIKVNFGFPYTSLNGNMYSLLSKSGRVGLRLPKEEREAFLKEFDTTLYQPEPGPLLKEYVTVPDDLLEDTGRAAPFFAACHAYATTLKPKKK